MTADPLQLSAPIPQLQTRGIFLLYCEVEANGLRVAIPAIDYARVDVGQIVKVVEPDSDRAFFIEVPDLDDDDYDVVVLFAPQALCPPTTYLQAQNN